MCGGAGNSFWIDSFDKTFNVTINENLTDSSLSNFIVSNLNGDHLWSCPITIDGAKIVLPGFAYDENHISFSVAGVSKLQMVVNNKCQEDTSLRAFSLHKISKLGDNYLNAFNIDGKAFVVYKNKEIVQSSMVASAAFFWYVQQAMRLTRVPFGAVTCGSICKSKRLKIL